MPFYASAAYSMGAWVALRTASTLGDDDFEDRIRKKRTLLFIGLPLLCVTLASALLSIGAKGPLSTVRTIAISIALALLEAWLLTSFALMVVNAAGDDNRLKKFFLQDKGTPPE